jgi:uncharacterized lipoprotein YddW (UPF0748 family)
VQIRPTADAFWSGSSEPWSQWLSGVQGGDPGYDPLAFLVQAAHARNLEFHAWFNPYRVSMQSDPGVLSPEHPARRNPSWLVPYGGRLYYDPGIPEVRRFVEDTIMDAVRRYDVDGAHLDDYFYPYPVGSEPFADDASFAQYGAGFADRGSWRRQNIDLFVHELSQRIKAAKPWVKFGISPFAVWRNRATDPEGSDTSAAIETYDDLSADTRAWIRNQWIDYVVPQVYWAIGFAAADYAKLLPWWSAQVSGTRVQLFVGQAAYKVGTSRQSTAWSGTHELSRHLRFNRGYTQVRGDVYFSAADVVADRLHSMSAVRANHYRRPALIPVMEQLGGRAPSRPVLFTPRRTARGAVRLDWTPGRRPGDSYALYRWRGATRGDRCDLQDAAHLIGTVRAGAPARHSFVDTTAKPRRRYTYAVSALDRQHHESPPSGARIIRR